MLPDVDLLRNEDDRWFGPHLKKRVVYTFLENDAKVVLDSQSDDSQFSNLPSKEVNNDIEHNFQDNI